MFKPGQVWFYTAGPEHVFVTLAVEDDDSVSFLVICSPDARYEGLVLRIMPDPDQWRSTWRLVG